MISVIIPVYNAAERLPIMLECLAAQTEKDYEILLIDDGSTDRSAAICDAAAERDRRIRVFHQQNSGVSAARNLGMKKAGGEYVVFLDADDEIGPEYFSVLLNTCVQTGCDIAVCDVVVLQNGVQTRCFTHEETILSRTMALNLLLTREDINSGPCGKIFYRKILQSAAFPPLKAYEDILFVKDTFDRVEKVAITNRTQYRYIQNATGAMSQLMKAPSVDIITATEMLMQFIKNHPDLSASCMYITLSHLMQYVIPLIKNSDEQAKLFMKKARLLFRKHIACILRCSAFPWKEKLLYFLFAFRIDFIG